MAEDPSSASRFQVGDLILDTGTHTLVRDGQEIPLTRLSFALFVALVRHAPNLMTQDELLAEVWGDIVVSEDALKQRIRKLRQAIGDESDTPQYIASVRGLGYRLVAPVTALADEGPIDGNAGARDSHRTQFRGSTFYVVALLTISAVALVYLYYPETITIDEDQPRAASSEVPKNSIVVLPFENISDNESDEYFSDGISEELVNLLTKVPELQVISRTSAFSYKDKVFDLPTIAAELNVAHVLEGSVRKVGERVRITAQLIEARTDTHLWSETYDRTLDDIFATQDEIAGKVVEKLKISLLGDAPVVQATDPEAYNLVLQARYLRRQGTADAYGKSVALFKQALAVDPNYAAAWAGLARGYTNQANLGLRPNDEGYPLAREAANRALALDPGSASAHRTLANIARDYDQDFASAARHFERAFAADPANTDSIANAATFAAFLGRIDQAIQLAEYTANRDPVSPIWKSNLAMLYVAADRPDDALALSRASLNLSPDFIGAHYTIGTALLLKGEPESALEAMQRVSDEPYGLIGLVMAYHALGQVAASDEVLAELIDKYEQDAAYNIAYVLAFRGEVDRAFEWLDRAVAYKDPGLNSIAAESLFANIQSDSRWRPFLESIGRSPEQLAAIQFDVSLPD